MGVICSDLNEVRSQMDKVLECKPNGMHCIEGLPDTFPQPTR